VNALPSRLWTRRLPRLLPWLAGAVLVAGFAALLQARTKTESLEAPLTNKPVKPYVEPKAVPLAPEARRVAVLFIRTAVARRDLDTAWRISGPQIRQGVSYREWMSGNIAVVPYPVDEVERIPVKIDWSYRKSAMLEVALLPKEGSAEKPQVFLIGVKRIVKGKRVRWVVEYWAPYAPPAVPAIP
jgi:hypothetical protein